MRIDPSKSLALIIDYQEKLIPHIKDYEEVLYNAGILLEGLNLLGIPLVVSRQYPKGLGDTVATIKDKTPNAKILDKVTFSCWGEESIRDELNKSGRKNIIICGIETHICCLHTCVDLKEAGFNVIMVADCLGSRKARDKKFALKRAAHEGAVISTYESILFELMQSKESPVFKQISSLVK